MVSLLTAVPLDLPKTKAPAAALAAFSNMDKEDVWNVVPSICSAESNPPPASDVATPPNINCVAALPTIFLSPVLKSIIVSSASFLTVISEVEP